MRPRRDSVDKRKRGTSQATQILSSSPQAFANSRNRPSWSAFIAKAAAMAGQSRKWMILVATIWIQAFTGTNFDFSAYSSTLKSVLGISQVQLNYLAVASDMGKVFGWSSGLALMYFPLYVVLFIAAFMGFIGYGIQWLVIRQIISLPYFLVRFLFYLITFLSS